jgi:hypothetical protein
MSLEYAGTMSNTANTRSAERIITGEITISSHLQKDYTNLESTTMDEDRKTCRKKTTFKT